MHVRKIFKRPNIVYKSYFANKISVTFRELSMDLLNQRKSPSN